MFTRKNIKPYLLEMIEKNNPQQKWVIDNAVLLHVAGSRLYGTNTENSDWDIRGITVAPKRYWVGSNDYRFEQFQVKNDQVDIVIYDIRKWTNLCVYGNPNVVETAYVDQSMSACLYSNDRWTNYIQPTVQDLVNESCYQGFHGYSTAQMHKMQLKQNNKTGRQYITEEFGFDTKFASHGFRILRQAMELAKTRKITFPRPDKDDLIDIRFGRKYKSNELEKCLNDWELEHKMMEDSFKNTVLPKRDSELHNQFLISVFDNYVNNR
jgi:predicted nucleotidyltransferase